MFGVNDPPDAKAQRISASWNRAPGRWSLAAVAFLFVLTWIDVSPPFPYRGPSIVLIVVWVGFALFWVGKLIAELFQLRFRIPIRTWPRWLHFPLMVSLMVLAIWANAPLRLGFALSRPAMDRVAREVIAGKRDPSTIHWVGIYPINGVSTYGDRYVDFEIPWTDFQERFVYDTSQSTTCNEWNSCTASFGGHWFAETVSGDVPGG